MFHDLIVVLFLAWIQSCLSFSPVVGIVGRPCSIVHSRTTRAHTELFMTKTERPGNVGGGRSYYEGLPSSPGWKSGQLETLVEWAVNDQANRPVIREYDPNAWWLWAQWDGTVLKLSLLPVLINMAVGVGVDAYVHRFAESSWALLSIPPAEDPLIQEFQGLNKLWTYQITLTTFILTFFTAEAYKHWKSVYFTTRAIQGRINDVCMLLTMGAQPDNEASQELVERCTRLIRKSHSFFWATQPTMSDGLEDGQDQVQQKLVGSDVADMEQEFLGPKLLTPEGLERLVHANELTSDEAYALLHSGLPPSQYAYILLEWVGIYTLNGLENGILGNSREVGLPNPGLEENLLRQLTSLRAEYFSIGDFIAGRMPLAYVQLVQVLVDTLVFLAPFALYCDLGTLSIPLVGLLTLFYKGLLELSKSFLDPFGVEGYPGQNLRVDVLVSELNFGARSRWVKAARACPKPVDGKNKRSNPQ